MVLDLHHFRARDGGDPEVVRESQRRRGADVSIVDSILAADIEWCALQSALSEARASLAQRKSALRPRQRADAATCAEASTPPPPSREELAALSAAAADAERAEMAAQRRLQALLAQVGNLVHEHAPLAPARRPPCGEPVAALRRLLAAGLAERVGGVAAGGGGGGGGGEFGGGWRPAGAGLLLQHALLARALDFAAGCGYRLLATPLQPPAERLAKLGKLRRQAGEPAAACAEPQLAEALAADPLGALHACSTLAAQSAPLRYAFVRAADGAPPTAPAEVWLAEVRADDGSCWEALDEMGACAERLHAAALGDDSAVLAELSAPELALAEARGLALRARASGGGSGSGGGGGGGGEAGGGGEEGGGGEAGGEAGGEPSGEETTVELARACCHVDYCARRLGARCAFKQLGERRKRHVHSLSACLCRPAACLLAVAAAAPPAGLEDGVAAALARLMSY